MNVPVTAQFFHWSAGRPDTRSSIPALTQVLRCMSLKLAQGGKSRHRNNFDRYAGIGDLPDVSMPRLPLTPEPPSRCIGRGNPAFPCDEDWVLISCSLL